MLSGIILPVVSMVIGEFYELPQLDFLVAAYVQPHGTDWFWIAILGVAALFGQIFLTRAFSFGRAGLISAVGFSNIVFSVFFGILLGDPTPQLIGFLGIILVIVSGVMISWQNRK
jgi:drug/metabolite transporter (DMT)-like permease